MNRTIKDATVKRFHYENHDQLRTHLADFMAAYNFARRLKTLGGLTPYEYICKIWTSEPDRFILDPIHQMPGLNSRHDRCDLPQGAPHGLKPAGEKGGPDDQRGRLIGRTKGGLNTKLHAVTDAKGRPLKFFMTAGQVSDYTGAAALLGSLPGAEWLIADRGYDADWFREALKDKGIKPCIPGRKSRGKAVRYDKRRYERRNRIEIMFGRLKDWRRVATRYDRCAKTFLSAVALDATVLFWL
jgi:transposase